MLENRSAPVSALQSVSAATEVMGGPAAGSLCCMAEISSDKRTRQSLWIITRRLRMPPVHENLTANAKIEGPNSGFALPVSTVRICRLGHHPLKRTSGDNGYGLWGLWGYGAIPRPGKKLDATAPRGFLSQTGNHLAMFAEIYYCQTPHSTVFKFHTLAFDPG